MRLGVKTAWGVRSTWTIILINSCGNEVLAKIVGTCLKGTPIFIYIQATLQAGARAPSTAAEAWWVWKTWKKQPCLSKEGVNEVSSAKEQRILIQWESYRCRYHSAQHVCRGVAKEQSWMWEGSSESIRTTATELTDVGSLDGYIGPAVPAFLQRETNTSVLPFAATTVNWHSWARKAAGEFGKLVAW